MPTDKNDNATPEQGVLKSKNGKPLVDALPKPSTMERRAFVNGLFNELNDQLHHHLHLVEEHSELQAKIMITERTLRLTRDHLKTILSNTNEEVPADWEKVLSCVRFIGARLSDACMEILRERQQMTTDELVGELNAGQFRFRTGTPLREIHGALLRHPDVKRDTEKDLWIYSGATAERHDTKLEIEAKFRGAR